MKNLSKKLGFTLIELLVVITIIGILATGAVSVYTSQIQKARDTTRINDIKALQSGVEQFYQDASEYPTGDDFGLTGTNDSNEAVTGVQSYVPKLPEDAKNGQSCNKGTQASAICGYRYIVANDSNGITNGIYELSTGFENDGNVTGKAAKDGGSITAGLIRFEVGLSIETLNTDYTVKTTNTSAVQADKDLVIMKGAVKK